jgi:tetratricopeptide (TPR) repeat protein
MQSSIKNYSAAVQFLQEGENCKMKAEQAEYWILHYAYSLYMFGQKEKALLYFKPLMKSDKPFTTQAAKYFTALILLEQHKVEEAKKLVNEIVLSKQTTKYVELAKQELK